MSLLLRLRALLFPGQNRHLIDARPNATTSLHPMPELSEDMLPVEAIHHIVGRLLHYMKGRLQTIALHADILLDPKMRTHVSPEDLDEIYSTIRDEAVVAVTVLNRFASGFGRLPTRFADLDLNEIVRSALKNFPREKQLVSFEVHLDPSLPNIRGDSALIYDLVENLVQNAEDALMTSGGRVTIRTEAQYPNAVLLVQDEGSGIPEDDLERIYDWRFSTKAKGLGIGLYLVKRSVDIHGASIECRSGIQGTTFEVKIPVSGKQHDR